MGRLCLIAVVALLPAMVASAQPAKLIAIRLNTANAPAQLRFWTEVLPCRTPGKVLYCGAVRIDFDKKAPSGPSVGSTIDHIGFFVPSLDPYLAKVPGAGYKYRKIATGNQIIIEGPDGASVELTSDPSNEEPIRFHHIHFHTPQPKEMQAWYAKVLGAVPGKRAQWEAGDLPGANLTYAPSNGPVAPTADRAISGLTFDVPDVRGYAEKVRDTGREVNKTEFRMGAHVAHLAMFVDPWGTSVTLVQTSK
jgi:catechol 2,3-dioxygenase-like lactoylglutathione lyase family enzyme